MNEKCSFVQALNLCMQNHLPNIILYDALGTNPLIDMASCIINFDLNICKFAWNLNHYKSFTNLTDLLKLHFTVPQFFNYSYSENKAPSEQYERGVIAYRNLQPSISEANKRLIREKKYIDRLVDGDPMTVHNIETLSLQHLAWNRLLTSSNPTTIYCMCKTGPKYVICRSCADNLFLSKPSCNSRKCENRNSICETCMNENRFILSKESIFCF